ncbi:MAG: bacillithiol biosynthesis deacetylase BshB1 [bacterium]|nr:bacillithiol biosynthesis deacetylase BshB1 [bacterium]
MAESTDLDVLAIAAHPDDAEITCGGLLIKMARLGRRTGVLDLTVGEMGTYGNEQDRAREAAAAAKALGLIYRGNLEIPDSAVEYTHENKLKIAGVIREVRPELVILPHWKQRHPDHLACSRLSYDACFLAGLKKLDVPGEPFRPRKIIYVSYFRNTDYSFLVDISAEFEQKIEAIAAYESQFGNSQELKEKMKAGFSLNDLTASTGDGVFSPGINIYDLMFARSRHLGQMVGVTFAEAYTIREQILVGDPQKMPVQSM